MYFVCNLLHFNIFKSILLHSAWGGHEMLRTIHQHFVICLFHLWLASCLKSSSRSLISNAIDIVSSASPLITAHYNDVIMGTIASQITSLTIVFSTIYLDTYQRKHQSSASLVFVWGIHWKLVNSPHKWPVTRIMFPFHDVIMIQGLIGWWPHDYMFKFHMKYPHSLKLLLLWCMMLLSSCAGWYKISTLFYIKITQKIGRFLDHPVHVSQNKTSTRLKSEWEWDKEQVHITLCS